MLLDRRKPNDGIKLTVGSEEIEVVSSVDISGITADDIVNFKLTLNCTLLEFTNLLPQLTKCKYV